MGGVCGGVKSAAEAIQSGVEPADGGESARIYRYIRATRQARERERVRGSVGGGREGGRAGREKGRAGRPGGLVGGVEVRRSVRTRR